MSQSRVRRAAATAPSISIVLQPEQHALPLYAQLYQQLRDHIVTGSLTRGAVLPSARTLAADLGISRNTVEAAIGRLCSEGFVTRRVGAGTVVSDLDEVAPFRRHAQRAPANKRGTSTRGVVTNRAVPLAARRENTSWHAAHALSDRGRMLCEGGRAEIEGDLRSGLCMSDVSCFPVRTWEKTMARVTRLRGADLLRAGDLQGDAALREVIMRHVRLSRGVRCTAEQVIILNSTQQALGLAAQLLLNEGDIALVEEPGYRSARATFVAAGARVRGVPVDEHGLQPEWLALHQHARLLYLTPSHHYPLGVALSLARRMAALEWARETSSWILEDDYDSEFRYDGRPIAAMQGLDAHGRVLYVGTFNKVLFPGIRLAYLIAPRSLVSSFVNARRLVDGGPPTLVQAVLAEFLAAGHFAAHLRRSRQHHARLRNLLVEHLAAQCGNALTVGASETGLHLVAHLAPGTDDENVASSGTGRGLGVAPLSSYYAESRDAGSVPRGLLFGFGGATEQAIRDSVGAIAARLKTVV